MDVFATFNRDVTTKAVLKPPQSKRSRVGQVARQSRSAGSAARLPPLLLARNVYNRLGNFARTKGVLKPPHFGRWLVGQAWLPSVDIRPERGVPQVRAGCQAKIFKLPSLATPEVAVASLASPVEEVVADVADAVVDAVEPVALELR